MSSFLVRLLFIGLFFSFLSCNDNDSSKKSNSNKNIGSLFTKIDKSKSNLSFKNVLKQDLNFNFLNYPYIYTGAGIAVGDINNDGLDDVYVVSNFEDNKLYLNKGNLEFEDITNNSKTNDAAGFSTGVAMLDVNNDGYLDIYVCKAGSLGNDDGRRNLLFVNNGDTTFTESSKKWGLDDPGYTTQAYSIDYDKDGDLDLYVVNYRYDFKNNSKINSEIQRAKEEVTSDQLYRNDGNIFVKVTGEAGLYNKAWGLSASIGDFNNDGWDDIYVANDFLEPDFLYMNKKDGTFENKALEVFKHIPFNSMGSDFEDINNDLNPDLFTVDMLAESYARSKENMASMSIEGFRSMVKVGYHHAYMANMLQINSGNGVFQETGQLSGLMKTDWSWTPLIADFDNDGLKDIFVTNGIIKDYTNQDFRNALKVKDQNNESLTLEEVNAMLPSEKLSNYIFKNNGDITFTKMQDEWGLNDPNFSNGAAYSDFDNDGDLDLIVNNHDDYLSLYRNNSNKNFISVKLEGPLKNKLSIGSKVTIFSDSITQTRRLFTSRGYESSVTNVLHFGLGDEDKVKKIVVEWPNDTFTTLENIQSNQTITVPFDSSKKTPSTHNDLKNYKISIDPSSIGINYLHKESDYDDYLKQLLLPQKQSTKGSSIEIGDINGDTLDDIFIGNAAGSEAATYIQNSDGSFTAINKELWKVESAYEDSKAVFFDFDNDKDLDLYVASIGYEFSENSSLLEDRLYLNDGSGNFKKTKNVLPVIKNSNGSVSVGDFDNDGDKDLFVGGSSIPSKYPLASPSYILVNDNGKFVKYDDTNDAVSNIGLITSSEFIDFDNDNDLDLLIVGEWNSPKILENKNNKFQLREDKTLSDNSGWWFSHITGDFNNDGVVDIIAGNIGENNKFHPKKDKPIFIYAKDFDNNGSFDVALSKINNGTEVPVRGKECSSQQNPYLLDKIDSYKQFANLGIEDVYGKSQMEDAFKLKVTNFSSTYFKSNTNGFYEANSLPILTQLGPTMSFEVFDVNNDGYLDIIGVGGLYDAEVETIRYDGNWGYVLINDGKGNFTVSKDYKPLIASDARDIETIKIGGKLHFVVLSNNKELDIFTFSNS